MGLSSISQVVGIGLSKHPELGQTWQKDSGS
jgi:hypothetical protein